ncbi:MAG: DUF177 domain-containing protein [Balneolaceae bacterium]|nr:DUF177 domain-containing protein [Balneolaceae bacterium]
MFTFKIFEIPDGKSQNSIQIQPDSLDLGDVTLKDGKVEIDFDKNPRFIRAELDIEATLELICDRSLESFDYKVNRPYDILFKFDQVEESEDENGAVRSIDHQKNELSIEQDVLDTLLVHLPVKKLHPRFLDEDGNPKEFVAESFGEADEEEKDAIDPRWEALKDLKKK